MSEPQTKEVALILETRLPDSVGILQGIAAYERINADWNFFLDDQAMSVMNPAWLFRKHWDGVICRHRFPMILEECARRGIACVDLDDSTRVVGNIPKVRPDNRVVGHTGAEHFLDRGFRNLAFCGFSTDEWSIERRDGFAEGAQLAGVSCSEFDTVNSYDFTPDWDLQERALISKWLRALPLPVGIMCCNDLRALQVIHAAQDSGFKIPEEIAVLGANNEVIRAEVCHPQLSSVPVNNHEWGSRAAEALDNLLQGNTPQPATYIDPLPVVVRRSTDALAIGDPAIAQALKIIREEACMNLRVDELARRVNVSRSLLERRFRKFLRRTPQEEIRSAKINRAKGYLLQTDKTLAEIAELIGFEHPEYLSVMFKRLTGESPRDFRQRHLNRSVAANPTPQASGW